MRLLQITHKPPYPSIDGGCIAMKQIAEGLLSNGYELDLITLSTHKHPFDLEAFPTREGFSVENHKVKTQVNPVSALASHLSGKSYNVSRFYDRKIAGTIGDRLKSKKYDAVILESIFSAVYYREIRKSFDGPILLRSHNVEYQIWELRAKWEENKVVKRMLESLAQRLKRFENYIWRSVDGILSISEADSNAIKSYCDTPVYTIPMGIVVPENPVIHRTEEPLFYHIGSMNWQPNVHGLKWLFEDAWPRALEAHPQAEFHLAGVDTPKWFEHKQEINVISHGFVESATDFMNKYDVMVVPLFEGSGIRIKILEAMALGKTVISTRLGAQGIPVTDRENILLAEDTKEFTAALEYIMNEPHQLQRIGEQARQTIRDHFELEVINAQLKKVTEDFCS